MIAIVVAAGKGARAGGLKQFALLAGKPTVVHALAAFEHAQEVESIILVVPSGDEERVRTEIVAPQELRKVTKVISGGPTRRDSVARALELAQSAELVLVHDGVRPMVTVKLIRRVAQAAQKAGAAVPVVSLTDTVKRVRGDSITETISRVDLVAAQTPQGFHLDVLRKAHARTWPDPVTDDAQLVERIGHPVASVEGEVDNIKITTRSDLARAEHLLARRSPRAC